MRPIHWYGENKEKSMSVRTELRRFEKLTAKIERLIYGKPPRQKRKKLSRKKKTKS